MSRDNKFYIVSDVLGFTQERGIDAYRPDYFDSADQAMEAFRAHYPEAELTGEVRWTPVPQSNSCVIAKRISRTGDSAELMERVSRDDIDSRGLAASSGHY